MSNTDGRQFDPALLDLHLGRLSAAEDAAVRARLAGDAALAEQHAALADVFAALATDRAPVAAPADLCARARLRVAAAQAGLRVTRAGRGEERAGGLFLLRSGGLRDVIAVAAMIVLAVGVGVPGMLNVRDRSQKIACSGHLASLGQAMQQYSSMFNDSLPFVGWNGRATWAPTGDPSAELRPNRRHVYVLMQGRFAAPQHFICPSRPHVPMRPDQVATLDDFIDGSNVSYAYQNMAGARPLPRDNPDMPVLSDENPLFADGLPLLDLLRQGLNAANRNSPAHRGTGQNILSLSGHVRWATTPNVGPDGDNIWTLQGVNVYTGREGPATRLDAHMLK